MDNYIKLTVADHNHNGLVYKEGLNIDPVPWDIDETCSPGGIYICKLKDLARWTKYLDKQMKWIWHASIPADALVYQESRYKLKVNRIILSNCRTIQSVVQQLWQTDEEQIEALRYHTFNLTYLKNPSERFNWLHWILILGRFNTFRIRRSLCNPLPSVKLPL